MIDDLTNHFFVNPIPKKATFIVHGPPDTGKSTFLEKLSLIFEVAIYIDTD